MTKTEQILSSFQKAGYREVKTRSTKYRCFEDKKAPGYFYWLGKCAAVRWGQKLADSISIKLKIKS